MTEKTEFKLPDIGLTAAFPPCRECYEMIEREALVVVGKTTVRPGARLECHACRNVLVATILDKSDAPVLDRFRPFDAPSRKHELVDFLFDAHIFSESTAKEWLSIYGLSGFEVKTRTGRERNFILFSRDEKSMVDVYVPVERGVFGRCAAREHKGGLVGTSARS